MTPTAASSLRDESRMVPVLTLVTWTSVLAIGVFGFVLHYARPSPPAKTPTPVIAQKVIVELTDDPLPLVPITATPTPSQPPPLAPPVTLPATPPQIVVAAPSPAISFAVPIQAAPIVEAAQASYRTTTMTQQVDAPSASVNVPQPLTYGVGEGKQPKPDYPPLAKRQGQEGVVVVRLSVGTDGRVIVAEASSPSPWPLLNESALRVVRQRWRFSSGPPRTYEVAIRFELNRSSL